MEQTVEFNEGCKTDDGPVSVLLSVQRDNRYGSVPGLDDAELADPLELEREIMLEEWGPVLALPVKGGRNWIGPAVDESGGVDWGAFGASAVRVGRRLRQTLRSFCYPPGVVPE